MSLKIVLNFIGIALFIVQTHGKFSNFHSNNSKSDIYSNNRSITFQSILKNLEICSQLVVHNAFQLVSTASQWFWHFVGGCCKF